jgi:apolipoprotein N-acyltransferase
MGAVAAWAAFMVAGLLADSGPGRRVTGLTLAAVLGVGLAAQWVSPAFTRSAGTQSVALLQGNIAQDEKFQPGTGVADALQWYGAQLQGSRASLVVAPETAIPLLPRQLPEGYWQGLQARYASGGQAALIGVPLGSPAEGYTNAVVGMKPGADAGYHYDKHHLVPFGEFIPPFFKWFLALMNIPLGDFNRGALAPPSFEFQGQRLAPNICYEDLFGEELGARFTVEAGAPTVLVNLSNIGWFGKTLAIDQHLQISRMRTLEFERPMLRATNTGPTVIIDHRGTVTARLAPHTRGVLEGVVEGRTGNTPYALWVSRLGLWPLWILALLVVAGAAIAARSQRR